MIYDYVVVGSSFSALGCIAGLIKSKKKILCIDGSEDELDDPGHKEMEFSEQNIPIKKFSFKQKSKKYFKPIEVLESYSFGGLSNVWGASALRYIKEDFHDWPISYDSLEKYYEECEKIMNVSHYNDDLSKELNIKENIHNDNKLNLYSNFIKSFLSNKHINNKYTIGYSRVALDPKCYKCMECSFGCSDNYIFNTRSYLLKLIKNNDIEYRKNLILQKFISKNDLIELKFKNSNNVEIYAKKLFIGAGSLHTPRIIINSLDKKKDLNLKESQVFFIPAIYTGSVSDNENGHHTLAQAQFLFKKNIKYNIGKISYQIKYDPKLTISLLKKQFGIFYKFIPRFLINKIFLIAGFINSDHSTYSGKIRKEDLGVDVIENKSNKKKIKFEILNQLKILEKNHKFTSVRPFLKLGDFGISYHLGASIPMINNEQNFKLKNNDLYCKKNGEISNFKNIFIIDSTNFTNIPSGSISLTSMANALRIATENLND